MGLALGMAACSAKNEASPAPTAPARSRSRCHYFGTLGFTQAVKDFEAANPNIKVDVQERGPDSKDYTPKLAQWIAAGNGAGDVVDARRGHAPAVPAGQQGLRQPAGPGCGDLEKRLPACKWKSACTADGKKLIGLGTDVGPLAMCYRSDLFQKAGLPADRDAVSKLWPTWDEYIEQRREVQGARTPAPAWTDSATSVMQPYIMQNADSWFYDNERQVHRRHQPGRARRPTTWALDMAAKGLTAKLGRWQADWDAAFKNAAFATVPCPPWMTRVSSRSAPATAARASGTSPRSPASGGNWGGSYLAVPEQSKNTGGRVRAGQVPDRQAG